MPDFHVGPYGAYIWPAFAITAAILVWMVADSLIRAARWKAKAKAREAERARKREGKAAS